LGGGCLEDPGWVVVVVVDPASVVVVVVLAATVDEYSPPRHPSTYQALRNCSVILSRGVYDIFGPSSSYHSHQTAPAHHD
jgi:hypothetical protein